MTTMDVIVHKDFPLAKGETLNDGTKALSDAGREYILGKLNLTEKQAGAYMTETFSSAAVFSVYRRDTDAASTYYACSFKRDGETGSFSFGPLQEVERVTVFRPKSDTPTLKAKWDSKFIDNLPDAAFAVILPGGKKDASGKTAPRSLRLLPHHGPTAKSAAENGSVDQAHLSNALSRVNQINAPAATKAQARAHLEAHAKTLMPKTRKALVGDWYPKLWEGVL